MVKKNLLGEDANGSQDCRQITTWDYEDAPRNECRLLKKPKKVANFKAFRGRSDGCDP